MEGVFAALQVERAAERPGDEREEDERGGQRHEAEDAQESQVEVALAEERVAGGLLALRCFAHFVEAEQPRHVTSQ